MKLPRRQFLHLAAGAAAVPALSGIARAQAYPTRPIRLVVPFGLSEMGRRTNPLPREKAARPLAVILEAGNQVD
jgi:hypothetical protein